jgi:predicted  nucleic acid-binding Zn-ribbon protein
VSEPAGELTEEQVREAASRLADTAANALAKVRSELAIAADAAEAAEKRLWVVEDDVAELPRQAEFMRESKRPREHLFAAQRAADRIDGQLVEAQKDVAEVQKKLERAAKAFDVAGDSLDKIDALPAEQDATEAQPEVPGQPVTTTAQLRVRLTTLGNAFNAAVETTENTRAQLEFIRSNLDHLRSHSLEFTNPTTTGELIDRVGTVVGSDVEDLHGGLKAVYHSDELAGEASQGANELEIAFRAAANPTESSAQTTPGSADRESRIGRALAPEQARTSLDR